MLRLVFDNAPVRGGPLDARVATRWCDDQGQAFATGLTAGDERWIDWPGLGVFKFNTSSPTVRFIPAAGIDRLRAADHFFRVVQPLILQAQGWAVLHASAAAGPDGAVVFCGLSGSGKSTLAYAVAEHPGFRQIADDAVVLRAGEGGDFSAVPIPFRPRLRESATAHFGVLPRPVAPPAEPASPHPLPLRAVVVLAQRPDADAGHVPATPTPVPRASAFSILLTHAHCFDEGDRGAVSRMVETYLAMAAAVPLFHLTYRPDFTGLDQLAQQVTQVVAGPLPT